MRDPLGNFLERWRIRVVLPHVQGRLLDLGCGMNHLVRAYGKGVGADVHQWGDVDVLIQDAARLPFDDATFDTVTIIAALNHIPNRDEAVRDVHRVLRPGGRFITTMIPPGISRLWHNLRKPWDADQVERGMKPGEVYGLTRSAMRQIMRSAGFEIVYEAGLMLWLNRLTVAVKHSQ